MSRMKSSISTPQTIQELVKQNAERLFHASELDVDFISASCDLTSVSRERLTSLKALLQVLSTCERNETSVFLLQQKDSWNRILLTLEGYNLLRHYLQLPSCFGVMMQGFGLKVDSVDENHIQFSGWLTTGESVKDVTLEMCYNIRYYEKHGRPGTSAIWSERQVGIYHSLRTRDKRSLWITIQMPEKLKRLLCESLEALRDDGSCAIIVNLRIHLTLFVDLERNWRAYINFLDEYLGSIVSL
jgi:hypothetical protein